MEDQIRNLQQEFLTADKHGDVATLDRLLAADFLCIGPLGFLLDKTAWLGRFANFTYEALETREVDVRLYDRAAIVRTIQHNRAMFQDQIVEMTIRAGHVWVDQNGEWRLAAVQYSQMPQGGPPANT